MLTQTKGLHHVTSMASDAQENNDFFTKLLGLRRVKKTINFDAPDVYHLYYGDETGSAGTIMTYFPFPHIAQGRRGAGEVSETVFSAPKGSLDYWRRRFGDHGVAEVHEHESFGERRVRFPGPDGDGFALAEIEDDERRPGARGPVPADRGLRGSARRDPAPARRRRDRRSF
jgi:glyoxalase family protein